MFQDHCSFHEITRVRQLQAEQLKRALFAASAQRRSSLFVSAAPLSPGRTMPFENTSHMHTPISIYQRYWSCLDLRVT